MTRTLSLLALAALAPAAQAFVLIDDFTVGEHHHILAPEEDQYVHEVGGLDRAHNAFGYRALMFSVQENFFRVPVSIDIGGGVSQVSAIEEVSSTHITFYRDATQTGIDLSFGDEVRVDLFTQDPEGRIADSYDMSVRDADGDSDISAAWVSRQGGIGFRKSSFNSAVDWDRITILQFRHEYGLGFGPRPLTYGVTQIYLVPEPGTLLVAGLGLASALTGRRRRRCARPSAKPRL